MMKTTNKKVRGCWRKGLLPFYLFTVLLLIASCAGSKLASSSGRGGEVVGVLVLMELQGLHGRDKIKCPVYSAIKYEGK